MLERLRRPQRRRGLVAVVSDFLDGTAAGRAAGLGTAAARAVRPAPAARRSRSLDPRELELPAAGLVTFVDTGDRTSARGADVGPQGARAVRRGRAAGSARAIAAGLRHAGAAHLQLRTDRDWVTDVVRFVVARRQFVVGAVGAGVR